MLDNKRETNLESETDNPTIPDSSHNNSIIQLLNEIKEYKKREKAFNAHIYIKDLEIKNLQNQIKDTIKNLQEKKTEVYLDPLLMGEFKILRELLLEKEEKIKAKEEELNSLQVTQNNPQFKRLVNKCRELHKENIDLYNYAQGGTLENLKFENGLEKSHIDILMLKLREKEEINKDLENEVTETNEFIINLNKKIKEAEEKTVELEKELNSLKGNAK